VTEASRKFLKIMNIQHHWQNAATIKILCVCTVITIMIAGLWPFHAPKNDVKWLGQEDGLQFGRYGSIVSIGTFQPQKSDRDDLGSLEVWIESAPTKGRHTILAFEGVAANEVPFRLQQDGQTLITQRHNIDEQGTDRTAEFGVERAFAEDKPVFITVTLGRQQTSVYLNGELCRTVPILGSSSGNFTGRLVLGNSPSASDSWPGRVLGVAIFRSELTAARVVEHYQSWSKNHQPVLLATDQAVALYRFSEHGGGLIRNQIDSATDLIIPEHYFVLHPEFLSLPWRHYHATWSYWADVAVNVAGFIPFGFFMVAYLSSVRRCENSAKITIALGFVTSLAIEVSQTFLPTRDSGVNDLITNTLGTAIGVIFYRCVWLQTLVSRAGHLITDSLSGIDNIELGSQI
jgi:hypothetical protein